MKTLGMLLDEAEIRIETFIGDVMRECNIPPSLMEYLISHVLSNVRETKYKEYVMAISEAQQNEELEQDIGEGGEIDNG